MSEKETVIIYYALTNALIDHIEFDFRKSVFNKQSLKQKSNLVLAELESITDKLYAGEADSSVVDQHVQAGATMINLFRLGIKMSELDEDKHLKLNDELNQVLKHYEVDFIM